MAAELLLDGSEVSVKTLMSHLSGSRGTVRVAENLWKRVAATEVYFDDVIRSGATCYGVNTGFGDLVRYSIDQQDWRALQERLVLSHAAGAGPELPERLCRSAMLLRILSLAQGASGIRAETLRQMIHLYNLQAVPVMYEHGSLGASGDLAPLSHLGSFLIGKGLGYLRGKVKPAAEIHQQLQIMPLKLDRKEGLSIINGTAAMTAIAIEAVNRIDQSMRAAVVGMALLLHYSGFDVGFLRPSAFKLKNFSGASTLASWLYKLAGSSATSPDAPFQAPYSFRCAPLIVGPLLEAVDAADRHLTIELNAVSDNPIYVSDDGGYLYHGGHFHGHYVSVSSDWLRIAACHLSGILDRQVDVILDPRRHPSLPPYLSVDPGRGFCGMEGAQYLLTALHIENKVLAHPRSTETLPTNGGNQDYVSVGLHSALATLRLAENVLSAVAVYLMIVHQVCCLRASDPEPPGVLADAAILLNEIGGDVYRDEVVLRERMLKFRADTPIRKLASMLPWEESHV